MANIVIIKSLIGEEIIADLISLNETDGTATLSRPRIVQFQSIKGNIKPTLVPWIVTFPDCKEVPVSGHYIATILSAPADVAKAYNSDVSGITLI